MRTNRSGKPLTFACWPNYASLVSANSLTGFDSPMQRRTQPPQSGFFTSVAMVRPFMGGSCGEGEIPAGPLPGLSTPHEPARPFDSGGAGNINRLQRSIAMPKASKSASAPKFLVISDSPHWTTYTGTRDQLISLGLVLPEHFPEGRQRIKNSCRPNDYGTFGIEKIKGDLFKLTKWHEVRPVGPSHYPLLTLES